MGYIECCFDDGDCLQTNRPSISPFPSTSPTVSTKPSISQEPTRNYEIEEPRPKSFLVMQYFLGAFISLILVLGVGVVIRYYRKKHGIADERPNRHRRRPPSRVQGSSPSRVIITSSIQPDTYNDNAIQYESNVSRWFNTPQVTDFMTSEVCLK